MFDVMIDIEGLATSPDTTILTIAAQEFDPFVRDKLGRSFYTRVTLESQADRAISQSTLDWWATQPSIVKEEAFGEDNRIPLQEALQGLHNICWHNKRFWAQGPAYDMTILEHAFKSYNMPLPWKYSDVRDSRTLFSLCPNLNRYPATHHALEDCCCQILLLWDVFEYLKIKELR